MLEVLWPELSGPFDFQGPEAILVNVRNVNLTLGFDVVSGIISPIMRDHTGLGQPGGPVRIGYDRFDLLAVWVLMRC